MSANIAKIKELLGNGLSNEVVANAVGVHPSYVSQLLSDETFYNEVVELKTKSLVAASARDRGLDSIEEKLIHKLDELVDAGMFYKPDSVLRALSVINRAVRRGVSSHEGAVAQKTVVTLNLPVTILNSFKKNSMNEVIEVTSGEGATQTLVTMPATALMSKLASQTSGKSSKIYDEIRRFIPSSDGEKEVAG